MSDEAPTYPVTLVWNGQTEEVPTPPLLHERLVILWQMRVQGVTLADADGVRLDAQALTAEAVRAFYG